MLKGIEDVLLAERPDWSARSTATPTRRWPAPGRVEAHRSRWRTSKRVCEASTAACRKKSIASSPITCPNLLLCPSETAVENLAAEGITRQRASGRRRDARRAELGDSGRAGDAQRADSRAAWACKKQRYLLATVHRSENTDDPERLSGILDAFNSLDEPVVFPVHPRTRKMIAEADCELGPHVQLIDPVGYLDMVALAGAARLILTDSGGLQKEAYWLGVPCVTMRDETEWVETVEAGWNTLVGSDPDKIVAAVRSFAPTASRPALYGDGFAAAKCVDLLRTRHPETDELAAQRSDGEHHGKRTLKKSQVRRRRRRRGLLGQEPGPQFPRTGRARRRSATRDASVEATYKSQVSRALSSAASYAAVLADPTITAVALATPAVTPLRDGEGRARSRQGRVRRKAAGGRREARRGTGRAGRGQRAHPDGRPHPPVPSGDPEAASSSSRTARSARSTISTPTG